MGARKIDDFFNPDGIIKLKYSDLQDVEKVLRTCDEKEYERRLPAILDNYERAKQYLNIDDYLYSNYFLQH